MPVRPLALALALLGLASSSFAQGIGPNDTVPLVPEAPDDQERVFLPWTGSLQIGGNTSRGNTSTTALSVIVNAEKKSGADRYIGRLTYNYSRGRDAGETEESINNDDRTLRAEYNRFVGERIYLLANSAYTVDEVEGLEARILFGVGGGYQFYETDDLEWNGEAGAAFVDEDYALDASDADYAAARLASSVSWRLNQKVRYAQDLELFQGLDDEADVLVTNDSRFEVNLGESMVATLRYLLDYDNTPAAGAERADHRLALTVGWKF